MTVRAISTTDRRQNHPAVQFISAGTQPASLRCALASVRRSLPCRSRARSPRMPARAISICVIEDDDALADALIAAGAVVRMRLLHYAGPLPTPARP